jgi:hypothetical protein
MKETVHKTKHPWLVGICVVAIAGLYFVLLAKNRHPEPGRNLVYDVEPYELVDKVETRFEETTQVTPNVENPKALATRPDGKFYVAGADAVALLAADGTELTRFLVDAPSHCIELAENGQIFLGMRHHVQVHEEDGTVQAVWPQLDERSYITSIAVGEEHVFVADAGNRVVLRYDREGNLQGRIGEANPDRDVPGLQVPSPYFDLGLDSEGDLWVVNPGLLGLESYRANGDLITSWYRPSLKLDGFSGCCNPTHIAFRADGKLITCEKGLVRVKVYDVTSGEFQELVAGSSLFPREQAVRDLAVDAQNRILVLDPRTNEVRIFEQKEGEDGRPSQSA